MIYKIIKLIMQHNKSIYKYVREVYLGIYACGVIYQTRVALGKIGHVETRMKHKSLFYNFL